MTAWHENDTFWETMVPFMFSERHWASAADEVDQLTALLNIPSGAKILDLCCGPGRHALELARRGFQVTGVDRTEAFIIYAQSQAEKEGLTLELIQADMREFSRPNAFDAVLMMYTSFGYFENQQDNRQVLINAHRSLTKGGVLLQEMMGKEVLARIFTERDWQEQDGVYFLQERKVTKDWRWMENRWILLQEGDHREYLITHWIYSGEELVTLLKGSGFVNVEIYGDLAGSPYDQHAKRLVAVAR